MALNPYAGSSLNPYAGNPSTRQQNPYSSTSMDAIAARNKAQPSIAAPQQARPQSYGAPASTAPSRNAYSYTPQTNYDIAQTSGQKNLGLTNTQSNTGSNTGTQANTYTGQGYQAPARPSLLDPNNSGVNQYQAQQAQPAQPAANLGLTNQPAQTTQPASQQGWSGYPASFEARIAPLRQQLSGMQIPERQGPTSLNPFVKFDPSKRPSPEDIAAHKPRADLMKEIERQWWSSQEYRDQMNAMINAPDFAEKELTRYYDKMNSWNLYQDANTEWENERARLAANGQNGNRDEYVNNLMKNPEFAKQSKEASLIKTAEEARQFNGTVLQTAQRKRDAPATRARLEQQVASARTPALKAASERVLRMAEEQGLI